jgi:hypothetical protein
MELISVKISILRGVFSASSLTKTGRRHPNMS